MTVALIVVLFPVQQPTFRSGSRLVPIYATVTGADGRLITNLSSADFVVLDNGVPQSIATFSATPPPISGIAMWDVSPAMEDNKDRARLAALSFVEALWPDDRIRFGTFSGQEFALSPLLTNRKDILRRVVDEELWYSARLTPLWDAVDRSLSALAQQEGRRVLVVLSAGESDSGRETQRSVSSRIDKCDCMLYAIGLQGSGLSKAMRDIAVASGGGYLEVAKAASLDTDIAAVVLELHSQYAIGIMPASDGLVHSLSLRVNLAGATVRARRSYVADKSESR